LLRLSQAKKSRSKSLASSSDDSSSSSSSSDSDNDSDAYDDKKEEKKDIDNSIIITDPCGICVYGYRCDETIFVTPDLPSCKEHVFHRKYFTTLSCVHEHVSCY
jgi:hypothetical protein